MSGRDTQVRPSRSRWRTVTPSTAKPRSSCMLAAPALATLWRRMLADPRC